MYTIIWETACKLTWESHNVNLNLHLFFHHNISVFSCSWCFLKYLTTNNVGVFLEESCSSFNKLFVFTSFSSLVVCFFIWRIAALINTVALIYLNLKLYFTSILSWLLVSLEKVVPHPFFLLYCGITQMVFSVVCIPIASVRVSKDTDDEYSIPPALLSTPTAKSVKAFPLECWRMWGWQYQN